MNTITELDIMINNKLMAMGDNDTASADLMATIDTRYHIEDTIDQFNYRLRNSVKNNFNKIFLTCEMVDAFREWETKLESLPFTASRVEIYSLAPSIAISAVGI